MSDREPEQSEVPAAVADNHITIADTTISAAIPIEEQLAAKDYQDHANFTLDEAKDIIRRQDLEIISLKEQVASLNTKLAEKPLIIQSIGPKLSHPTKSRPSRRPVVVMSHQTVKEPESTSIESAQVTSSDSDHLESGQTVEDIRKRVVTGGGGFNLFGGFNPSSVQLRSNKKSTSMTEKQKSCGELSGDMGSPTLSPSTISASLPIPLQVNEPELVHWISSTIASASFKGEWKAELKDGQILCKLINALFPDQAVKVNTGRFPFMHMENINNFVKIASAVGVPKQYVFVTSDLYECSDIDKVLQCLTCLKQLPSNAQ